jgi:translation initiation factor 3 subunit H
MQFNQMLVETQFGYQTDIQESVVLVYDPLATTHGALSIKAYRLSDICMKLRKENAFTKEG